MPRRESSSAPAKEHRFSQLRCKVTEIQNVVYMSCDTWDEMGRKSGDMGRESDEMGRKWDEMGRKWDDMGRESDEMGRKKRDGFLPSLALYI